nr:uncharacterized protein LOC117273075 [Nicotiana tomentosiformis]
MEKKCGEDVNYAEVFAETHKKKKKDDTIEGWIEPRASETFDKYHTDLDAWRQTQPEGTQPVPEDMNAIWTQAAGGVNKGRVYGIGVQPSSSRPPTTYSVGHRFPKKTWKLCVKKWIKCRKNFKKLRL